MQELKKLQPYKQKKIHDTLLHFITFQLQKLGLPQYLRHNLTYWPIKMVNL